MSLLVKAQEENIEILTLSKNNLDEEIAKLNTDETTKQTVRNAVSSGMNVIISASDVTIEDWSGIGYMIVNPETGTGAYMITGGLNGGMLVLLVLSTAVICGCIASVTSVAMLIYAAVCFFASIITPLVLVASATLLASILVLIIELNRIMLEYYMDYLFTGNLESAESAAELGFVLGDLSTVMLDLVHLIGKYVDIPTGKGGSSGGGDNDGNNSAGGDGDSDGGSTSDGDADGDSTPDGDGDDGNSSNGDGDGDNTSDGNDNDGTTSDGDDGSSSTGKGDADGDNTSGGSGTTGDGSSSGGNGDADGGNTSGGTGSDGGTSGESGTEIADLTKTALKHPLNRHAPSRVAQQFKYMDEEAIIKYLDEVTFFNKSWTEEQIIDALNYGYKKALSKGVTTGEYNFKYWGDNVTVYLEEGVFKSGYGDYVYSYEEIMSLLND